jgi:membrane-associated protease RseP (regulator of RpoE activity)
MSRASSSFSLLLVGWLSMSPLGAAPQGAEEVAAEVRPALAREAAGDEDPPAERRVRRLAAPRQRAEVARRAPAAPAESERNESQRGEAPRGPGRLGIEIAALENGAVQVRGLGPDSAAGLLAGDVLLAFEGRALQGVDDLIARVRALPAGHEVQLRLRRTLRVDLDGEHRTGDGRLALGAYLGAGENELVVRQLREGFPAATAGLQSGDRIVSIDGEKLASEGDLVARMRTVGEPRAVEVGVERDVRVRLGAAPAGFGGSAPRPLEVPRSQPRRDASPDAAFDAEIDALRRELEDLREELRQLREELRRRDIR